MTTTTTLELKPKIELPPVNGTTDPVLLARYVRQQREIWDKDYPFRPRDYFSEEEIFKEFENPSLKIGEGKDLTPKVLNPNQQHLERLLFSSYFGAWSLKIAQYKGNDIIWDIAVWNGATLTWHPDEAANQILDHHSDEVFNRWRRMARAQYDEAIALMLSAAKEAIPSFSCGSITCCDSSERLMQATPGIIVQHKIAYLIW